MWKTGVLIAQAVFIRGLFGNFSFDAAKHDFDAGKLVQKLQTFCAGLVNGSTAFAFLVHKSHREKIIHVLPESVVTQPGLYHDPVLNVCAAAGVQYRSLNFSLRSYGLSSPSLYRERR